MYANFVLFLLPPAVEYSAEAAASAAASAATQKHDPTLQRKDREAPSDKTGRS